MTGQRWGAVLPDHAVHEPVPEDVYGSWSSAPSPDGQHVAFVSDRSGEPHVWIAGPRSVGSEAERWTPLATTLRRVLTVSWSPDGAWLGCVTAAAGASRHEVWLVRPDGSDLHLAAGAGHATAVIGTGPWHGWSADGHLLVTETGLDAVSRALAYDPGTGERRVLTTGPLLTLLDLSRDGRRALLRLGPRGHRRLAVVDVSSGMELPVVTGTGPGSTDRGCLSPDGRVVYARSDVGRDFAALVAVPLDGAGGPTVVAERPGAELQDVVLSADGRQAVLVWNVDGGHSALSLLDVGTGTQREVAPLPRDVVDECRFSPDGSRLVLTAESWSDPRGVWEIDVGTGAGWPVSSTGSHTLISSRGATTPTVDADELIAPELRSLRSSDGTVVTGWLYRPEGAAPYPTMIHLHGGPEAQERPVYNSLFQSFVAAGVAVFAPNVRGSTGLGRVFGSADDLAGRYGAIDDVAACAAYLVGSGVAEPHRIGVMGRSYGGYLTLAALTWHPELFAVGIDVCGMADFASFYTDTEPWIAAAATSKYGDPERDAALLRDLSPIHRIDRLRAPLLVVHGAEDTNVPIGEAEQVVAALAERGVPHRYLRFEGEGHELLATPNRVAFVQASLDWVVTHLDVASPAAR
jgi:dipeptidyl aminopeptidase/acylaminoacyl peptidase